MLSATPSITAAADGATWAAKLQNYRALKDAEAATATASAGGSTLRPGDYAARAALARFRCAVSALLRLATSSFRRSVIVALVLTGPAASSVWAI
eukprot:SAG31_NODE_146_length_22601_cov_56.529192_27_plen_95_part_00